MNRSESMKELGVALAKANAEIENPKFDSLNPHFKNKFASLAAVRDAIVPVYAKHGLSIVQSLRGTDFGVECETMILHLSGEWVSDVLALPVSKNDAQGYGSSATYARRYSLQAFANVVGDQDDDGNAAAKAAPPKLSDEDEAHRRELIESLQEAADGGTDVFAAAWKALPQSDRELIGKDKFAQLKKSIRDAA